MSTYVMSDLHGEYRKFLAMLAKIDFSEEDTLYVLGDVIDRGEEPIALLTDLSQRSNVIPLVGNHEVMMLDVMEGLMVEIREDNYASHMTPDMLHRYCVPTEEGRELLREAFDTLGLSARGHDRILKVARTIADLAGEENILPLHLAEAIQLRTLDKNYNI
jgi:serine/threonine protein phosphatase 1